MIKWLLDIFKPITTIDELIRRKKTWQGCLWWAECNIEYAKLGSTYPPIEEIFKKKRGNCKAFGVLAFAILQRFGFSPHIIGYAWRDENGTDLHHCVVVFKDGPVYRYVSNCVPHLLFPSPATLVDAIRRIEPAVFYAQETDAQGSHLNTLIAWEK